jgi:hypothetical protein
MIINIKLILGDTVDSYPLVELEAYPDPAYAGVDPEAGIPHLE